jgi:CspA family cold shock protein
MTDYINGRVKWFDIKKGYGFIQRCDNDDEYFIHHARLNTDLEFSTLYDGEYVSFKVTTENNKSMADDVKGVGRGPLLCESRRQKKEYRMNHKKQKEDEEGEGNVNSDQHAEGEQQQHAEEEQQ